MSLDKFDLGDIARGRRITAVTARELSQTRRHARPARPPRWKRLLRRFALRMMRLR